MKNNLLFLLSFLLIISTATAAKPIYCPEQVYTSSNGHTIFYHFIPSSNNNWKSSSLSKNSHVYWVSAHTSDPDIGFTYCTFTDYHGNFFSFSYITPPLFPDTTNENNWKYDDKKKTYECTGGSSPILCPYTTVEPDNISDIK